MAIPNRNPESVLRLGQITAFLLVLAFATLAAAAVFAHGERMHQPSLRMRTVQWLDMSWTRADGKEGEPVMVGDVITVKGTMVLPSKKLWPNGILAPDPSYLQTGGPASVFLKKEAYIGEIPIPKSIALELGEAYEFTLVVEARVPGSWHLHPALQVTGSGPVVGPGKFFDVGGAWSDYVWSAKAGRDERVIIENMENFQMGTIASWHIFWIVAAVVWILWWARRPMLLPRFRALREGHKDLLILRSDVIFGVLFGIGVLAVVMGAQFSTWSKYPDVIPLQTGKTPVNALIEAESPAVVSLTRGEFNVPARALKMNVTITNKGDSPLWVGEFTTAGLRFVSSPGKLPAIVDNTIEATLATYPEEYLLRGALDVRQDQAIQPGQTAVVEVIAADAAWEVEGLAQVVDSPVRRFGGVFWLVDENGERFRHYVDFSVSVTYDAST